MASRMVSVGPTITEQVQIRTALTRIPLGMTWTESERLPTQVEKSASKYDVAWQKWADLREGANGPLYKCIKALAQCKQSSCQTM